MNNDTTYPGSGSLHLLASTSSIHRLCQHARPPRPPPACIGKKLEENNTKNENKKSRKERGHTFPQHSCIVSVRHHFPQLSTLLNSDVLVFLIHLLPNLVRDWNKIS